MSPVNHSPATNKKTTTALWAVNSEAASRETDGKKGVVVCETATTISTNNPTASRPTTSSGTGVMNIYSSGTVWPVMTKR